VVAGLVLALAVYWLLPKRWPAFLRFCVGGIEVAFDHPQSYLLTPAIPTWLLLTARLLAMC
jgi:hypothetical protein